MVEVPTKNQKNAIECDNQRLLMIAGPGSGKTFVLINRIVNFIEVSNVNPENILAITFTNKSADEMLDRLRNKIGNKVIDMHISTIHSFCQTLITEHAESFGLDKPPVVIDEIGQFLVLFHYAEKLKIDELLEEMNQIIALENLSRDAKRGIKSKGRLIFNLVQYFNKLKNKNINPNELLAYYQSELNNATRDLDRKKAHIRYVISQCFKLYEELLREQNFFDFGDLINFTNRKIEENPELQQVIQDKYKYVFVDEYQDTSKTQERLLKSIISDESYLTVVGDDDQSIYQFRGATVENILGFSSDNDFKISGEEIPVIKLLNNHRSTPEIVAISKYFIETLKNREEKDLKTDNSSGEPIFHYASEDISDQAEFIVQKIKQLIKEGKVEKFSDIAVLFRSIKRHSDIFAKKLNENDIPFEIVRAENLTDIELIINLHAFLLFLHKDETRDDPILIKLLLNVFGSLFIIDTKTIQHLKTHSKKELKSLDLDEIGVEDDKYILNDIKDFRNKYKNREIKFLSLLELVFKILGLFSIIKDTDIEYNNKKLYQIAHFTKLVAQYEKITNNNFLGGFLSFLGMISNNRFNFEIKGDFENSVKLMTIHQSKGLEFDTVFIPNLADRRFPIQNRSFDEYLTIPLKFDDSRVSSIQAQILNIRQETLEESEEKRLFYVAVTRAKNGVFLINPKTINGINRRKSIFLHITKDFLTQLDDFEDNIKLENTDKPKLIPYIDPTLSFSKLEYYLKCPLRFKIKFIYGFATPYSFVFSYGSSLHAILEEIHNAIKDNTPYNVQELIEKNWVSDGYFSEDLENEHKDRVKKLIDAYLLKYESKIKGFVHAVEQDFKILFEDFYLIGIIDLILNSDKDGKIIIDLKAGKAKENKAKYLDSVQLPIYTLAAEDSMGITVSKQMFHFLGDDTRIEMDLNDNKKNIETVRNAMKSIKDLKFPAISKKVRCKECEFLDFCPLSKN